MRPKGVKTRRCPLQKGGRGQGNAADHQRAPDELDRPDSLAQRKHRDYGGEHRDEVQEDRPSRRPDAFDTDTPGYKGRYRGQDADVYEADDYYGGNRSNRVDHNFVPPDDAQGG